jgi:hypothetical protein
MTNKVAELRKRFLDVYVQADASVPELARFAGKVGRVVTVNENGAVLVDFAEGPWYDIPPAALRVVPKPEPKKAEPTKPAGAKAGAES